MLSSTKISLKGLHFFESFQKRNYEKYKRKYARILFAKIEKNETYQCIENLIDFLIKKFIDNELLQEEQLSHIKYDNKINKFKGETHHITILRARNDRGFPVEDIMDNLSNFSLGSTEIKSLDLSTRFHYSL